MNISCILEDRVMCNPFLEMGQKMKVFCDINGSIWYKITKNGTFGPKWTTNKEHKYQKNKYRYCLCVSQQKLSMIFFEISLK